MDLTVAGSEVIRVPIIPYTDLIRYLQGAPPSYWIRGIDHCMRQVMEGAGGIGLAPGCAYIYFPLTDHDRAGSAVLKDVEEIWLAFDLEGFLNQGENNA